MARITSILAASLLLTATITMMAPTAVADPPGQPPKTDPPNCDDGVDNDGDGKVDYPDDPGCESPSDDSEKGPNDPCNDKGPRYGGWSNDGFFMWLNEQCGYDNCMDHGTPVVHPVECALGQSGVMPDCIGTNCPAPEDDSSGKLGAMFENDPTSPPEPGKWPNLLPVDLPYFSVWEYCEIPIPQVED